MNPYLVLGVAPGAGDAEIRQIYLEQVRQWPPERDAARFQAIRSAYEKIASLEARRKFELFDSEPPAADPLETLRHYSAATLPLNPPNLQALQTFLRECAKP